MKSSCARLVVALFSLFLPGLLFAQTLRNLSYPPGQKVLVGVEGGTIRGGLKIELTQDGKPLVGRPVHFRIAHSPGEGTEILDPTLTDANGIATASLRIGSKAGDLIVSAFTDDPLHVAPVEIVVRAYRGTWIFLLVLGMVGGLAIFLYGMDMSAEGLQKAAGDRMRYLLGRLTNNPVMGVLVGALATAAVQSSSATTVMVVGFVTATLMTMTQAIGVIYGANIGTTLTVQLIAFNVSEYSPILIAIGFFLLLFGSKSQIMRFSGMIVMGFGFIFFGMGMMSEAMNPLRSVAWFTELLTALGDRPVLGVLFATVFTAIVQSSGAVIGISIAMASQGILSLPAAIVISFGANIGTCATALLSSLGASREGKRVALVHLLFNTFGVLIFLPFLGYFTAIVELISAWMGSTSIARSIANAHMLFNTINTLIFLPLVRPMARLVEFLLPRRKDETGEEFKPQFLVGEIKTSSIALEQVYRELLRMGGIVRGMMAGMPAGWNQPAGAFDSLEREHRKVEILSKAIGEFLARLSRGSLTGRESREAAYYLHVVGDLKHISESILRDFGTILENNASIPAGLNDARKQELNNFHGHTLELYDRNVQSFEARRIEAAEEAGLLYNKLKNLARRYRNAQIAGAVTEGAAAGNPALFADLLDALRQSASQSNVFSQTILENLEV